MKKLIFCIFLVLSHSASGAYSLVQDPTPSQVSNCSIPNITIDLWARADLLPVQSCYDTCEAVNAGGSAVGTTIYQSEQWYFFEDSLIDWTGNVCTVTDTSDQPVSTALNEYTEDPGEPSYFNQCTDSGSDAYDRQTCAAALATYEEQKAATDELKDIRPSIEGVLQKVTPLENLQTTMKNTLVAMEAKQIEQASVAQQQLFESFDTNTNLQAIADEVRYNGYSLFDQSQSLNTLANKSWERNFLLQDLLWQMETSNAQSGDQLNESIDRKNQLEDIKTGLQDVVTAVEGGSSTTDPTEPTDPTDPGPSSTLTEELDSLSVADADTKAAAAELAIEDSQEDFDLVAENNTLGAAQGFMDFTTPLRDIFVPDYSAGTCPVLTFSGIELFGSTMLNGSWDDHCVLLEDLRSSIRAIVLVLTSIVSVRVIMEA